MRNFPTNFLLLIICCLWCHVQPTDAGGNVRICLSYARKSCRGYRADYYFQCFPQVYHSCAGGNKKRSDINDLTQDTDLQADGEGPEIQVARGGERKAGGKENVASGGDRGDELRSEIRDLRQLLEEKQLLDIANRQLNPSSAPLDSTLGRLRSLLRTAPHQVVDQESEEEEGHQGEEEDEEEESPRLNSTYTDRRYSIRYTLTMLGKILDDIERRIDMQSVSDSVSET